MYDVSPAVRVGLEYTRIRAQYGAYVTDAETGDVIRDREGCLNSFRVGAYYFF